MTIVKKIFGSDVRLKTQLVISFIAIFVLISIICYTIIYFRMLSVFQKNNQESTYKEFVQADYIVNTLKNEVGNIFTQMSLNTDVYDYLNYSHSLKPYQVVDLEIHIFKEMDKIRQINTYIDAMYLVKRDGKILGQTAKNNYSYSVSSESSPFFSSRLFTNRGEQEDDPRNLINWFGNVKSEEVGFDLGTIDRSVIAGVKAFNTDYGQDAGIFIIFINENAINDIYKHLTRFDGQNMYIIDQNHITISSSDKSEIGKPGTIDPNKIDSDNGNFDNRIHGVNYFTVYHKMNDSNWVLVNELPINEYMGNITEMIKTLGFIFLLALVMSIALSEVWMRRLTLPLLKLQKAMVEIERGGIGNVITGRFANEFGNLINRFNQMSLSILELVDKNNEAAEKKRFYEIEALRSQINPHFLFNTLNSIKWMAKSIKATQINEAINYLGEILRPIYKNNGTTCTIAEEIEYANNYVKIMNLRFGDQILISFDVPEKLMDYPILRFILQPLIENAINHGFVDKEYAGKIRVEVRIEKDLLISVIDDGSGIELEQLRSLNEKLILSQADLTTGIGVINVNQRIKLHYGTLYGIHITSGKDGVGTVVTCALPFS